MATVDTINNYNFNDYSIASSLTTSYTSSRTITNTSSERVFGITVSNETENELIFSSIKFHKRILIGATGIANVLVSAYYLENPVTLAAGESTSINLTFSVGEVSTVS